MADDPDYQIPVSQLKKAPPVVHSYGLFSCFLLELLGIFL